MSVFPDDHGEWSKPPDGFRGLVRRQTRLVVDGCTSGAPGTSRSETPETVHLLPCRK